MALIKTTLHQSLKAGLLQIFTARVNETDESADPMQIIDQVSEDMANTIADAVDTYIKSGDIVIGPSNFTASNTAGTCVITPASPAKMK